MIMIVFGGESVLRSPGGVCHTHLIRRLSPYSLPAEGCKGRLRKGVGDYQTATVLGRFFSPLMMGEMLSVLFFLCFFVSGLVSFAVFAVPLFLGSLFEKISGANFVFGLSVLGLLFFGGFLPMFLLYVLVVRSRNCLEKVS